MKSVAYRSGVWQGGSMALNAPATARPMTLRRAGRGSQSSEAERAWGKARRKVCRSPALMRADASALRLAVQRFGLRGVTAIEVQLTASRLERAAEAWDEERRERKARERTRTISPRS